MKILTFAQIAVSILLVVSILLQNRGSSLGGAFGADQFGSYYTKRGFEKFLLYFSIALAAIFIILGIVNVYLGSRG
jgi:protein translocase SecG subunit